MRSLPNYLLRLYFITVVILLTGALIFLSFQQHSKHPARAFLDSLEEAQLEKVVHDFNDFSRESWHFFPVAMLGRPGIAYKSLDPEQQKLLNALLEYYLSESGYDKTMRIMNLESVLAEMENNPKFRDPGLYHINFYGTPELDAWAWSFEGHHVSLNFTIVGEEIAMVPRFLGANPAEVASGPHKGERVLAAEEDLAFELLHALTPEQQKQAVFQEHSFWDLASSTSSEVGPLSKAGIAYSALNSRQQAMLMKILQTYLNTMPQQVAEKRLQLLDKEDLQEVHFGWAGSKEKGKPHYYRIQGKTFLVEFDNTQNDANHIHTVWRDFDGDFGRDLIRAHLEYDHQH